MTVLMRIIAAVIGIAVTAGAAASEQARRPVLVELFTSQGCSSCPPADRLLAELAEQPHVIALSLHVDYWDYLGWKDEFGSARHTERQRAYALRADERMIYTPQIVIEGQDRMVGSRADAVRQAISRRSRMSEDAELALSVENGRLIARLSPVGGGATGATVTMAWLSAAEEVRITSGENSGRTALYRNVVRGWETLGEWDGGEATFTAAAPAEADALVVMVQDGEGGAILCSRRIDLD